MATVVVLVSFVTRGVWRRPQASPNPNLPCLSASTQPGRIPGGSPEASCSFCILISFSDFVLVGRTGC
jgi:hypothetical protein